MDLRQLHYFLAIAETLNVSRAATLVWISQPALSRQLQLLEQELNVTLFERKARGMVLTEAGQLLQLKATAVVKNVAELKESISAHILEPAGTVTMGIPSALRPLLTRRVAARFCKACPKALLRIREGTSRYIRDGVASGDIDIAFFSTEEPSSPFECIPILSENLVVIGRPEDGFSMDQPMTVEELCQHELILTPYPNSLRQLIDRAASAAGHKVKASVEVDMAALMVDLVHLGLGLAVLPSCAIHEHQDQKLSVSAAPIADVRIAWVVAHSKERMLSLAGQYLLNFLSSEAKQLVNDGMWPTAILAPNLARD